MQPFRLDIASLPNGYRVSPQVFSGGEPHGEEAFAKLQELGVKAVISVDGGEPPVALAKAHGLRYVHLPIGYDGINQTRIAQLLRAANEAEGPVYVHCHHGKHRGPAAVAVICEGREGWTPQQAEAWLKQAGTSPDYSGLYRTVAEFKAPDPRELKGSSPLPESVAPPALIEQMLQIDEHWSHVLQGLGKTPPTDAQAEATLLREAFTELERASADRGDDFLRQLATAKAAAKLLETGLKDKAEAAVKQASAKIKQSCKDCHAQHRDQVRK